MLQLACLLSLLAASVAHAQGPVSPASPRWLARELVWAQQVEASAAAAPLGLKAAAALDATSGFSASVAASSSPNAVLPNHSLARLRGRYHRMKVAGYVVAASAIVLGIIAVPMLKSRKEHVDYYGSDSCVGNGVRYVLPPAFAIGMAVGLGGSLADHQLTREHGPVARQRGGWRTALAALGVATTMGLLSGTLVAATFCSS